MKRERLQFVKAGDRPRVPTQAAARVVVELHDDQGLITMVSSEPVTVGLTELGARTPAEHAALLAEQLAAPAARPEAEKTVPTKPNGSRKTKPGSS